MKKTRKQISKNVIVYDNYLPIEEANRLHDKTFEMPSDWYMIRRTNDETGKNVLENHPYKFNYRRTYQRIKYHDTFKYHFLSTQNHSPGCPCSYCELSIYFRAHPPEECEDLDITSDFLSVYEPGDFLSQHTDKADYRSWAFTYTVSKIWRPEWGGVLNIQENKEWLAFPPTFNRLILMDLTGELDNTPSFFEPGGINHFVSEVIPTAPLNRITYSGWYGKGD